eukprot:137355-Amorphochlora_amoeboformis.AAC.1
MFHFVILKVEMRELGKHSVFDRLSNSLQSHNHSTHDIYNKSSPNHTYLIPNTEIHIQQEKIPNS